jgi:hypothetical protein
MGISNGILAVPQNRKLPEFLSELFQGRGNTSGTKIEGTLRIPFKPFRGRLPFRPKPGPPGVTIFPMG